MNDPSRAKDYEGKSWDMVEGDPPTPREVHEQEQLISGLRHLAMILHAFYHVFCEEGFTDEQAMGLVAGYQCYLCETEPDEDFGS